MPRLGLLAPWLLATLAPLLAHAMDPVAPAPPTAASATAAPPRTAPPATTAAPPATTAAPGSAPMAPPPTTAAPPAPAPYPYPYPYPAPNGQYPPSGQYPPPNGQMPAPYGSAPAGAYPYPWWGAPPAATRPPEPPTTTVTERYFKPILVSDVLSTALLVVGLTRDNSAMISFGVVSFLVVPPIIHFAENNRTGIGFASFGIRLGIPLVTALTLAVVCEDNNRCDTGNAALTGMVIGAIGTSALDQGIFARRSVVVRTGSVLVPMIAPRREGGAQLGLGGTF